MKNWRISESAGYSSITFSWEVSNGAGAGLETASQLSLPQQKFGEKSKWFSFLSNCFSFFSQLPGYCQRILPAGEAFCWFQTRLASFIHSKRHREVGTEFLLTRMEIASVFCLPAHCGINECMLHGRLPVQPCLVNESWRLLKNLPAWAAVPNMAMTLLPVIYKASNRALVSKKRKQFTELLAHSTKQSET